VSIFSKNEKLSTPDFKFTVCIEQQVGVNNSNILELIKEMAEFTIFMYLSLSRKLCFWVWFV